MSVDLASVTAETFEPHVGSSFTLSLADGGVLALELITVEVLRASPGSPRPPFALRFRTPAVKGHVPQQIHALAHPVLGTLEIFLVPLGADGVGMRYEAVFA